MADQDKRQQPEREQPERFGTAFAPVLKIASRVALTLLFVAFAVYALFRERALIPPEELPGLWGLPTHRFLEETGVPVGWGWLRLLAHPDVMALGTLAVLGLIMPVTLIWLASRFRRRGKTFFFVVAILQAVVLFVAASGLVSVH